MEVTSTDPLRTRGSALSSAYSPGSVGIHRSPSAQAQPAAPDAVDQPERERDQDWTTYHCTDQREYQYPADRVSLCSLLLQTRSGERGGHQGGRVPPYAWTLIA